MKGWLDKTRVLMKDLTDQPSKGKYLLIVRDVLGEKTALYIDSWALGPGVIMFMRKQDAMTTPLSEQKQGGVAVACLPLNESTMWAVVDASYAEQISQWNYEKSKVADGRKWLDTVNQEFGKKKGKQVMFPDGTTTFVPLTDDEVKEIEDDNKSEEKNGHEAQIPLPVPAGHYL